MKKIVIGSAAMLMSSSLFAGEYKSSVSANVVDYYRTVEVQVGTKEECHFIQHKHSANNAEEVLGGVVIGGIIGNILTEGDKNGTIIGGIMGGVIADNNSRHGGDTHRHKVCRNVEEYETRRVYDYSAIRFYQDGRWYETTFVKSPAPKLKTPKYRD